MIQTAFACSIPQQTTKPQENSNLKPDDEHLDIPKDVSRSTKKENENLQLVISIKGTGKNVCVPARPSQEWLHQNTTLETVDIWGIETDAYMYSSAINSMITDFLHKDVALVYKGPTPRVLKGNGAPEILGREQTTNFPDVLPLLIANEESLRELNGRLRAKGGAEIGMERFRPNVVVKGGEGDGGMGMGMGAWSEDEWKTVRVIPLPPSSPTKSQYPPDHHGSGRDENSWFSFASGIKHHFPLNADSNSNSNPLTIDIQARCARCQVPNVEPDTAIKDKKEPWDTLVSYRRVDEGIRWKPCFGMLSVPRDEGVVAVGMGFEVVETTKEHFYVKGF